MALVERLMDGLQKIDGTQILGPASLQNRYPVVSFMLDGVHPHDVAQTLDSFGVAVRAGHHCAQPLMDRFDLDGTTRVSIAPYNDNTDIDALLTGVAARGPHLAMSDQLYQDRIVALAKAKTGAGKLAAPTKSARRDNPLCGDRVTIDVRLDDNGQHRRDRPSGARLPALPGLGLGAVVGRRRPRQGRHRDLRHDAERAIGREEGEAAEPFAAFAPVKSHKSRHECVLLPFEALTEALS